jgi:hypothetical protein
MTARYSTPWLDEKQAAIGKLIDFSAAKRARARSQVGSQPEGSEPLQDAPMDAAQPSGTVAVKDA